MEEKKIIKAKIDLGQITQHISANGMRILKYSREMSFPDLNEYKLITAPDQDILQQKVDAQLAKWKEKYTKIVTRRLENEERENNIEEAEKQTKEAQKALKVIEDLLIHTLSIDDAVDWEQLKNHRKFDENNPKTKLEEEVKKIKKPSLPPLKEIPKEPQMHNFTPHLTLIDKIFSSKKEQKIIEAEMKFKGAVHDWKKLTDRIEEENKKTEENYKLSIKNWEFLVENKKTENEIAYNTWIEKEKKYYANQKNYNDKIDNLKVAYSNKEPDAIIENCELVLNNSLYPDSFPKNFEFEYTPETKILILDYSLPKKEDLPTLKEVKYIPSKDELKETHISDAELLRMYDSSLYKITLRTIHELFEADVVNVMDVICFNGWVNSINPATGKEENNCILSIQANKSEFIKVDLLRVEPKACFKQFKGVGSSKLSGLTPIAPILQISKTDKRFVDAYDVVKNIDDSTNIAAMDWEDFEHLIREIFEKEFSQNGGEVKVTQASRDGGVDAVAFDPDPIRGGKIVIQAKRYTNVVGVSAVRDLYGTVMNEGATKGILVTTSNYGSDAYEFAKGKPLTLLSGSNLLHLLEKHGHKVKIDIQEAKKILNENKG
jgi:restriction system protein